MALTERRVRTQAEEVMRAADALARNANELRAECAERRAFCERALGALPLRAVKRRREAERALAAAREQEAFAVRATDLARSAAAACRTTVNSF